MRSVCSLIQLKADFQFQRDITEIDRTDFQSQKDNTDIDRQAVAA